MPETTTLTTGFTITAANIIAFLIGALIAIVLFKLFFRKSEGAFARLFQNNADLDSTLEILLGNVSQIVGIIIVGVLIYTMIMVFHDDVKAEAGYIIQGAMSGLLYALGFKQGVKAEKSKQTKKDTS